MPKSHFFSFQHLRALKKSHILIFALLFCVAIILDQWVKIIMLNGFVWDSEALTIGGRALVYNKGVAFSMLSFLESYLKYIQILFLCILVLFALCSDFFIKHYAALGILVGAGVSNVIDRFIYGGVVDYVYWHYGFDFAIFNLADVLIDISVILIIYEILREKKHS